EIPSLVAGASLLVDYILTVAVSISAGVAAILSAAQNDTLFELRVPICLACVLVMMLANLRGLKESGTLFAGPTYVYIVSLGILLAWGLFQSFTGHLQPLPPNTESLQELTGGTLTGLSVLILLRAFSSGAIALSGVEAISNGVPAFRKPESKNAATTLAI